MTKHKAAQFYQGKINRNTFNHTFVLIICPTLVDTLSSVTAVISKWQYSVRCVYMCTVSADGKNAAIGHERVRAFRNPCSCHRHVFWETKIPFLNLTRTKPNKFPSDKYSQVQQSKRTGVHQNMWRTKSLLQADLPLFSGTFKQAIND